MYARIIRVLLISSGRLVLSTSVATRWFYVDVAALKTLLGYIFNDVTLSLCMSASRLKDLCCSVWNKALHCLRLCAAWWTSKRQSAPRLLRNKSILQMLGGWGRRQQPSDSQKDYRKLQECYSLMKACFPGSWRGVTHLRTRTRPISNFLQDTLAKADELMAKGNVQSARTHWEFAVNNVAPHAQGLNPVSDGVYGNVKLWRDGITHMSQHAKDRCVAGLSITRQCQSHASITQMQIGTKQGNRAP